MSEHTQSQAPDDAPASSAPDALDASHVALAAPAEHCGPVERDGVRYDRVGGLFRVPADVAAALEAEGFTPATPEG